MNDTAFERELRKALPFVQFDVPPRDTNRSPLAGHGEIL